MKWAILLSTFLAGPAMAHDWYDPGCCDDKDCQMIKPDTVTFTDEGIVVTLSPADHFMVRETKTWVVKYDAPYRLRDSQDNDWHACVLPNSQTLMCLYKPPMGM